MWGCGAGSTFLIGPIAGITTVLLIDCYTEGANKDYVKEGNKTTAADPAAPTPFLVKAQKDKKEKKKTTWFGRKKNT